MSGLDPNLARRVRRQAAALAGVTVTMLAAAFAAVPLYDLFCRVTGFGGTTQIAQAAPSALREQRMEIRFDANHAPGLPVEFAPVALSQTVRLGETALAFYRITNTSDRPVTAMATYNVTPHKTAIYFAKLECFCFQDRVLQPGQTMELPVVFYVAPEIADDRDTEEVRTITLSYTFFERAGAARQAALGGAGDAG